MTGARVLLGLTLAGGVALAWLTQRSQRKCLVCRLLLPSIRARVTHELVAHGLH